MTVVQFNVSNDSCIGKISTTDTRGEISNSSAVEIANCEFMYTRMCIFLLLEKGCVLIHVHV